jgi:two-component system cell cycle sensor histidine kinase/response regulator CckA
VLDLIRLDASGEDHQDALFPAMFRALAGAAESYLSCVDRQRRILYLNRTLSRSQESVVGLLIEQFVAEPQRVAVVDATEAAFVSGEPQRVEFDAVLSDGTERSFETRIVPFRGSRDEPLAMLVTTDVSDQRRLSQALSRSEELRRLIVDNLPDFVLLLDRQRVCHWVNRLAPKMELSDIIGRSVDALITPETLPQVKRAIESVFETGTPAQYEVEGYGDGVQQAWYSTRVVPVRSESGIEAVLLMTSDATQRKRAELALRESEERFRSLTEHSPDLIAIVDRSRVIEFINRAPKTRGLDAILGRRLEDFAEPEQHPALFAAVESVFATGVPAEYDARPPGRELTYRVRVAPFYWREQGGRALVVATDVTKARADELSRQSLQAQLHQAQRRESIGLLAGGIAHDFNNLLQVIHTNLQLAAEVVGASGLAQEELGEALRATERAAELTTHLLAIGRRQRVDPRSVELSRLIERSLRMLRRVIPETIEVSFEGSSVPCFASVDSPQVEQVLLNLCLNARDAMPNGGRLNVSVGVCEGSPKLARLSVTDTGAGIAEENLKQVFEPFFTTKRAGSGLGLAVAAGIVAAHGGVISARSRLGQGSTFSVDFPLSAAAPAEEALRPKALMQGDELVLVAEDEPLVRAQAVRVLRRAGYSVLEAEDGLRAVEVFQSKKDEIKLVLLDVIMPGLDGWQVFLRLEALDPAVKVLFITGYAASALPEDFSTRGKRLLSKPYKPQALLECVRAILDGAQ